MKRIFLGLGSNLGDREANILQAIRHLKTERVLVNRVSPIYETEPEGVTDQPMFLNAVAEAQTTLVPAELLSFVKKIETEMKRSKTVRNGPRVIDIDILFYQSAVVNSPDLQIPHPRFRERRFVLAPLADLAPDLRDPITHRTVAELLRQVTPGRFRRI